MRELNLTDLSLPYERLRRRDARAESRLLTSMARDGQKAPIVVVRGAQGRYAVIDGHKRVRALRRLKADVAVAEIWEGAGAEALVRSYQQAAQGGWSALEEGWLVGELIRKEGWGLERAGRELGRSKSWASRRLGLVESLPERVQELVQVGKIGAFVAAKHLLPLARANAGACERLAEKLSESGLSSRQSALVCEHYKRGRGAAAENILADPARFVRALEAAQKGPQAPGLSEAENRCLQGLELVAKVSSGLTRSLPESLGLCEERAWTALCGGWERSRERFGALEQAVGAVLRARRGG